MVWFFSRNRNADRNLLDLSNREKTISFAERLTREIVNEYWHTLCLLELADALAISGDRQKASLFLREAEEDCNQINEQKDRIIALSKIGSMYFLLGDSSACKTYFERAISELTRISDLFEIATLLGLIAKEVSRLPPNLESGRLIKMLFDTAEALPSHMAQSSALCEIVGSLYDTHKDFISKDRLLQSLRTLESIENLQDQQVVLRDMVEVSAKVARADKDLKRMASAVRLAESINSAANRENAFIDVIEEMCELYKNAPSDDVLNLADDIVSKIQSDENKAEALGLIGAALGSTPAAEEGAGYLHEARRYAESVSFSLIRAMVTTDVAAYTAQYAAARNDKEAMKRAIELAEQVGPNFSRALAFTEVGFNLVVMGEIQQGQEFLNKAYTTARSCEPHYERPRVFLEIVEVVSNILTGRKDSRFKDK